MTTPRNVLVLGQSQQDHSLLELLRQDPNTHIQQYDSPLPDLVVLAGASEDDLAVALSMLESHRPLLVVAGEHLGSAVVHRLALVANDSHAHVGCWLPAVEQFDPLDTGDQAQSPPRHLKIDRADNRPLEELLFFDLARLNRLAGPFHQVTATFTATNTAANITFKSDNGTIATWTLRPTTSPPSAQLLVDDAQLELNPDNSVNSLDHNPTGHLELEELVDIVETFAATQESARRRRAIDLHHEPTTERTVFKSQMATVGCLLLLLTLVGLVAMLVLGTVLDPTGTRSGRANRVGFLLVEDDFQLRSPELSPGGQQQLDQIASRIGHVQIPVVVAETNNSNLDQQRRNQVVAQLEQRDIQVARGRVVIDSPPAKWTRTLLQITRIAWLAPLVLFLALQALILATRNKTARN
jgi:hypothetical protein